MKEFNKKIVFEDGTEYYGYGFGADAERTLEIVFNTSMVGYQEIMSDPSYTYQAVVMTYPIIGNYGINDEDYETKRPSIGAMVVRDYNDSPSNFRCTRTLSEVLWHYDIPGIYGVDTRALTRSIRDVGSRRVLICDAQLPVNEAVARLNASDEPHDAVEQVSCKAPWTMKSPSPKYNVVAIDCGIKLNIVRSLAGRGCNVTVMPYNTTAAQVLEQKPDGVFLSNGPGNPEDVAPVIKLVQELRGKLPICGICLGHQMISLSYGAKTYKLKFGHRGGNHPVRRLSDEKIEITSQNHSYAVDESSLAGTGLEITHINILDNTVEGVQNTADRVFSVQYHPESAPGPQDSSYLFDRFIEMMSKEGEHNA